MDAKTINSGSDGGVALATDASAGISSPTIPAPGGRHILPKRSDRDPTRRGPGRPKAKRPKIRVKTGGRFRAYHRFKDGSRRYCAGGRVFESLGVIQKTCCPSCPGTQRHQGIDTESMFLCERFWRFQRVREKSESNNPNKLTDKVLKESETGVDLHRASTVEELFDELERG